MNPFRTARALAPLGAATLLLMPIGAAAQQQTPAEVAKAAFEAIAQKRWSDAAALVDSAAAARLRHQQIERVWNMSDHPPTPPRVNPSLPQCVADYFKARSTASRARVRGESLLGLDSAEDLERLGSRELVARMLEYGNAPPRTATPAATAPPQAHFERAVLGQVVADDSTAYVVFHQSVIYGEYGGGRAETDLLPMVRRADGWRITDVDRLTTPGISTGVVILRSSAVIAPSRTDSGK